MALRDPTARTSYGRCDIGASVGIEMVTVVDTTATTMMAVVVASAVVVALVRHRVWQARSSSSTIFNTIYQQGHQVKATTSHQSLFQATSHWKGLPVDQFDTTRPTLSQQETLEVHNVSFAADNQTRSTSIWKQCSYRSGTANNSKTTSTTEQCLKESSKLPSTNVQSRHYSMSCTKHKYLLMNPMKLMR